ncbi:hypothetical protein PO878_10400 [Iamia majanohamensis]|uniref:UDP-N-acetylmuramyl pentapeptide phosphotransferase/UDP-N-acetylglucosamine-1-phosphate transferase n=1 Tax=Iamia majanohamensis TaxID=467976 RepID=A0AAE9Y9M2_9ACTN|nr:hypothetical protein [Iamia majanohamensis]WCO69132.1 hypothetical protein PO878_10400 [Iamia majanohamensis]
MAPLIAAVLGLASGVGLWVALQDVLSVPALRRLNMAGRVVPVGGGIVLVLAVVLVAAGDSLASAIRTAPASPVVPGPLLVAVLGFGFLGLLDDLLESGDAKGFRGHVAALSRGQLTTGAVKLVGGALVALVVAPLRLEAPLPWLLVDGALIALSANLANLLDRAPGRLAKVTLVLGVALVVGHLGSQVSIGLAVVLGATAALLVPDLRARVMLGDAGANVVGAALGWAFVSQAGGPARVAALVVVAALNVLSERVSFSAVIASTPGLRTLDALGRRTEDRSDEAAGDDAA